MPFVRFQAGRASPGLLWGRVAWMKCLAMNAREGWLVLHEKGGKERRLPAHHLVREAVRAYLLAAGLAADSDSGAPLFQSSPRHTPALSGRPMSRQDVWKIVKRRCEAAGLPDDICNHSFRATGITIHQQCGATYRKPVRRNKSVRRADPDLLRAGALLYMARGSPELP